MAKQLVDKTPIHLAKVRSKIEKLRSQCFDTTFTILDCNYRWNTFLSVHSSFNMFSLTTASKLIQTV